jgi:hypothetical protein
VSYKKHELLTLREHLGSPSDLGDVRVAHLFSFLCCVFFLRPVSSGPNVISASLLSILDFPSVFSIVYLCLGAVITMYILNICALKNIYWSTLIKIISSQHHLHSNILEVYQSKRLCIDYLYLCSTRIDLDIKWAECGYHWMAVWSLHAIVNVPNQDLLCHCHKCSTCPPGTTPLVGICIAIYNIAIYTFKWIIGVLTTIQIICCWFISL